MFPFSFSVTKAATKNKVMMKTFFPFPGIYTFFKTNTQADNDIWHVKIKLKDSLNLYLPVTLKLTLLSYKYLRLRCYCKPLCCALEYVLKMPCETIRAVKQRKL